MKTRNDKIEEFTNRIIDICSECKDLETEEFKNKIRWTIRAAVYYGQRIIADNKNDK